MSEGTKEKIRLCIKRNIAIKGQAFDANSILLKNNRASYDSDVWMLLKSIASVSTRDICNELASGSDTLDDNGRSLKYKGVIVGGSSGITALNVALGKGDLGIGTDTGGSIALSYAFYDIKIVSYKPTRGLISRYGVIELCPALDTVGLISKSPRLLFNIARILWRGGRDMLCSKEKASKVINNDIKMLNTLLVIGDPKNINGLFPLFGKVRYRRHESAKTISEYIVRIYMMYVAVSLVSVSYRYGLIDYSKLSMDKIGMDHFRNINIMSVRQPSAKKRMILGMGIMQNPRTLRLVIQAFNNLRGLCKKYLKGRAIVYEQRLFSYTEGLDFLCNISEGARSTIGKNAMMVPMFEDKFLFKMIERIWGSEKI